MNAKGISVKVLKDYNIKQISECDAAIVCEKLDVSVLEKCVNEFETLKTYKLEVLGIVYGQSTIDYILILCTKKIGLHLYFEGMGVFTASYLATLRHKRGHK